MLKDLCFEIIQTCPNKCKFCSSNSSKDKKTIIPIEHFKRVVTYFINQGGIGEISISGGEPFLHPDLFEMVKFCRDNGLRTVIFTSGIKRNSAIPTEVIEYIKDKDVAINVISKSGTTLEPAMSYIKDKCNLDLQEIELNEPWNERLKRNVQAYYERMLNPGEFTSITRQELERLKNLDVNKIVFDWQALDEEIDNDLMGRKALNTYLMDSLIRASRVGLDVDVHFIPMKPNYRQFPDILECLEMAGVKNISILNFVPQGRGLENKQELMLDETELKEFGEILKREKENYSGNIRIGIPLNGRISHLCTAGTEKLDIKYDGTILPCPAFKEMNVETMEKYGIKLHSIYDDLEKVVVKGGTRSQPLCRQVYGFHGNLNDDRDY